MSELHFNMYKDISTWIDRKYDCSKPIANIENMGKKFSIGPIKPNEPVKNLCEVKKSFLTNAGKVLQSTPRKTLTPRTVDVGSLIYSDEIDDKCIGNLAELEFNNKTNKYESLLKNKYRQAKVKNNYHKDLLDFLPLPTLEVVEHQSPPDTPPPAIRNYSMDYDSSYQDEFFTDDFSTDSIPDEELGLPDIY